MAQVYIDYDNLQPVQRKALTKIASIRRQMHYASIPELQKLHNYAEHLWWKYLPAYASQYCQLGKTWWVEAEYNELMKLRTRQQLNVTININISHE